MQVCRASEKNYSTRVNTYAHNGEHISISSVGYTSKPGADKTSETQAESWESSFHHTRNLIIKYVFNFVETSIRRTDEYNRMWTLLVCTRFVSILGADLFVRSHALIISLLITNDDTNLFRYFCLAYTREEYCWKKVWRNSIPLCATRVVLNTRREFLLNVIKLRRKGVSLEWKRTNSEELWAAERINKRVSRAVLCSYKNSRSFLHGKATREHAHVHFKYYSWKRTGRHLSLRRSSNKISSPWRLLIFYTRAGACVISVMCGRFPRGLFMAFLYGDRSAYTHIYYMNTDVPTWKSLHAHLVQGIWDLVLSYYRAASMHGTLAKK